MDIIYELIIYSRVIFNPGELMSVKRKIIGKKAMTLPVLIAIIFIALTLILVIGILLSKSSAIFGS